MSNQKISNAINISLLAMFMCLQSSATSKATKSNFLSHLQPELNDTPKISQIFHLDSGQFISQKLNNKCLQLVERKYAELCRTSWYPSSP